MNNSNTLQRYYNLTLSRSDYLLNISKKNSYIYSETPKVACSTIKRTLQKIEIRNTEQELQKVHSKTESPLLSPSKLAEGEFESMLKSDKVFKFSFVRNPFSRILSAYLDKIVVNEWEKKRHYPKLGFKLEDEVSFLDFLNKIKVMPPVDMDIHFCPQTTLIGYGKVKLDFIGKFENLNQDFNKVLLKISSMNNVDIETIEDIRTHSVGTNEKITKYYNDGRIIDIVRRKFKEDFENFMYFDDPAFA